MSKRDNDKEPKGNRPKRGGKGAGKPKAAGGPRKSAERKTERTAGSRGAAKGAPRPKTGGRSVDSRPFRDRDDRDGSKSERSSGQRREGPYKGAKSSSRSAGKPYKETRDERDGGKAERSSGPRRESPYKGAKSTNRGAGKPYKETRDERDGGRAERSSGPRRESSFKGPKTEGRGAGKSYAETRGERGSNSRAGGPGRIPKEGEKPWSASKSRRDGPVDKRNRRDGGPTSRRPFRKGDRNEQYVAPNPENDGLVRLNKYLAQAGVGSRREADELITSGAVTVNSKVVTELGTKVKPEDIVHFGGQKLSIEQKRYVLLNKPKDTITTTNDPQERHTVMSLISKACGERLYPVGRLDRNTTGVLLLTNDGDLAKKLTHPSHGAEKLYHATLDRSITVEELHRLAEGVNLDDGPAHADEVSFVGASKREVGLRIHMGRNRIVRRMFQALGAEVVKLDRVMFAGLTKKELQRGHWRHLSEKEVTWLRQMRDAPKDTKSERGGRRTRLSQGSE
ncbi:MAG: pseudouridine synthase [Flavobacteriales bacterium]|jgi:23S rRNA pseudouridine2605 synthase|nr:pseudouridine synthase [Flavobacteriales bacterium]MBP9160501.1 pseudouridine synthase [Flavobacteriales bacterium]MCI1751664.1 pseudouridine synthase [Flavobacteriales bacterium]